MAQTETLQTETAQTVAVTPALESDPTRAFSRSVMISAVRCTLTYVVFPWILPIIGVTAAVGPWVGIAIGVVAIASNVASIRRFWRADHRWKWPVSVLNVSVIGLLAVLLVEDFIELA